MYTWYAYLLPAVVEIYIMFIIITYYLKEFTRHCSNFSVGEDYFDFYHSPLFL